MLCKSVNLCNEKLLFLQSEDGIQMDVVLTILMIPKGYLHMPKAYITLRKQYITFPEEIYHFPVRENPFSQCPFRCGFLNAVMQGGSLPRRRLTKKLIAETVPIAYAGAIINRPAVKFYGFAGNYGEILTIPAGRTLCAPTIETVILREAYGRSRW